MDKNMKIESGDIWSTRSSSSIPGMLVLVDCPDGNTLSGYPMFCESSEATAECFYPDGHPDFNDLLDERWVNFANPVTLDARALFAPLGHSQYALDCLRAFQNGKIESIPLSSGIPLINGIGDTREFFHEDMRSTLKKLAGTSLMQLTVAAIKKTIVGEKLVSFMDFLGRHADVDPDVLSVKGISSCRPHLTACFSKFNIAPILEKCIPGSDSFTEQENNFGNVIQINGKEVWMRFEHNGMRSSLMIVSTELKKVEVYDADIDEWKNADERNRGLFITAPSENIPQKIQFSFEDGSVEMIELNEA